MKTSIIILLFLLVKNIEGQDVSTDHIKFQNNSDSTDLLYQRLKIKDTNSLVVVISRVGLWTYGQYTDIFAFSPNQNPRSLEYFESSNLKMKKDYKNKYRIKGLCLDSIRDIIETNNFIFNVDSLKIMPEPITKDSITTMTPTADGLYYSLGIYKGNWYSHFNTRSPEAIIKARAEGYEEKEKFLTIIKKFDKIKNCCQL